MSGTPGRPAFRPCGTNAAYKRHIRRGEPTCDECRAVWAAYCRDLYHRRKGNQ